MPGPSRTPLELLKARGSTLAKGRESTSPATEVAAPDMPSGLSKEAKAHWQYIVPQLLARRTLSPMDLGHLEGMCRWWGLFRVASAAVDKLGVKSFKGNPIDHPRVVMRSAWEQYSKAAQRFGLTPADLSRVQAAPEPKAEKRKPAEPVMRIAQ